MCTGWSLAMPFGEWLLLLLLLQINLRSNLLNGWNSFYFPPYPPQGLTLDCSMYSGRYQFHIYIGRDYALHENMQDINLYWNGNYTTKPKWPDHQKNRDRILRDKMGRYMFKMRTAERKTAKKMSQTHSHKVWSSHTTCSIFICLHQFCVLLVTQISFDAALFCARFCLCFVVHCSRLVFTSTFASGIGCEHVF